MHITQPGIILFVAHYEACTRFYRDVLQLPVAYTQETLTCFALGSAYFMVEQGGLACATEKTRQQSPVVMRLDVRALDAAVQELAAHGVVAAVQTFAWGRIAVFLDPDNNRWELKESP